MNRRKVENGANYPADAYLIVPDRNRPTTWKLRTWADPTIKVTLEQLDLVTGQLAEALRTDSTGIPADAIRRLAGLYESVDAEKAPPLLDALLAHDAARRVRALIESDAGKPVVAAMTEPERASLLDALATLEEAYLSTSYVMAKKGKAMSYESRLSRLSEALRAHVQAESSEPYSGCSPVATFDESIVYEREGRMYERSYSMGDDGTIAFNADAREVTATFKPTGGTALSEARETDLLEYSPSGALKDAKIDEAAGIIRGTVLITSQSANGAGGREYSEKALRQVAAMSEGLPAYANHVTDKAQAFRPRDVKEIIGRHRNVQYDPVKKRVTSDLHILESQRSWIFPLAKDMGDVVGNSLVSRGLIRSNGEKEVVEEIVAVRSGDLVSDPATTKGLFEHREAPKGEGRKMNLKEWANGGARPPAAAVVGTPLKEWANGGSGSGVLTEAKGREVAGLNAETEALRSKIIEQGRTIAEQARALTEANAKLDGYQAADKTRAKADKLAKFLAESDLAKKHGKNENAVTDRFRQTLLESDEAKWKEMVDDRIAILDSARPTMRVQSEGKGSAQTDLSESGNGIPADAHARAYAALTS